MLDLFIVIFVCVCVSGGANNGRKRSLTSDMLSVALLQLFLKDKTRLANFSVPS